MANHYIISTTLLIHHANPPLWTDFHPHYFKFEVDLIPLWNENCIHGVDMVHAENELITAVAALPDPINNHVDIPNGTTEQLADWLMRFKYSGTIVRSAKVYETEHRVTVKENHLWLAQWYCCQVARILQSVRLWLSRIMKPFMP